MSVTISGFSSEAPEVNRGPYVFVNRAKAGNNNVWYTLDDNGTPQPLDAESFTGRLVGLDHKEVERMGSKKYVIVAFMETADGTTIPFETGATTDFAKGLLLGLNEADPSEPVTIVPVKGSKGMPSALFCNLFQNGDPIRCPTSNTVGKVGGLYTAVRIKFGFQPAPDSPQGGASGQTPSGQPEATSTDEDAATDTEDAEA